MAGSPVRRIPPAKWEHFAATHPEWFARLALRGAAEVEQERARVARLYALRAAPFVADLTELVRAAESLRESLLAVAEAYTPGHAADVLTAAGLPIPGEYDLCTEKGADDFEEPLRACRRLAKKLGKFLAEMDSEASTLVNPPAEGVRS